MNRERLIALWENLLRSPTLEISCLTSNDSIFFSLKDELSEFPLAIEQTWVSPCDTKESYIIKYGKMGITIKYSSERDLKSLYVNTKSLYEEKIFEKFEKKMKKRSL